MQVKQTIIPSCCGKYQIYLTLDNPLIKNYIENFKLPEYTLNEKFIQSGIFYLEDKSIIATATLGSNKITIRTKSKEYTEELNKFIKILEVLP